MHLSSNRSAFTHLPILVVLLSATVTMGEEPKGSSPPKVSSKQLAADFVKNATAAGKKYGERYNPKEVVVEGVVVAIEDGKYGKGAKLAGTDKLTVAFLLRKEDEQAVKKGDKIVIKGKCRGLFEKDKIVDINGAALVKEK